MKRSCTAPLRTAASLIFSVLGAAASSAAPAVPVSPLIVPGTSAEVGGLVSERADDRVSEVRSLTVDHVAEKSLDVRGLNGSISVQQGGTDKVEIRATLTAKTKERLPLVKVHANRTDDGDLRVYVEYPGRPISGDGVSFEIKIPSARGVNLETSNGSIQLSGLAGVGRLESSNGAIRVENHDGSIDAETSNGSIELSGVSGKIDAESSNGQVVIRGGRSAVRAETSNAAIDVQLAKENPGPVRLDTSNGNVRLVVGPSFAGVLRAETSNASVNVRTTTGKVVKAGKDSATIDFGPGEKSSIESSNAAITLESVN